MRIKKQRNIAVVYDAVSISKDIEVIGGSLNLNYYAESATYIPNRYVTPLVLKPIIYVADPNKVIEDGNKNEELLTCEWFENDKKIISGDDYKINKDNSLTVFKNSQTDIDLSFSATWLDPRKKQVITIEDSITLTSTLLSEEAMAPRLTLDKPQNWIHNPLKGERVYTIKAYVSTDKVYESAVEWYYVDKDKKDILIDEECSFYVSGQYTNALDIDSNYMENVIIKAKNIDNDKLKEIYWFFDKEGNPITYSEPDKTIIGGSNVFSLPESPITSKLDYRIEGLTLTNLVQNGDFSDGKKGWNHVVEDRDVLTIIDGGLNVKFNKDYSDSLVNLGAYAQIDALIKGNKYYFKVELRDVDTTKDREIQIRVNGRTYLSNKIENNIIFSSINTYDFDNTHYCFVALAGGTPSIKDEYTIKSLSIIDLTSAFGAGNEPTKEWCDEHISGYFEGTKSVTAPLRIKSVGENLFNIKDVIPDGKAVKITETGYIKGPNSTLGITINLKLKPNTDYKFGYSRKEGLSRSSLKDLDSDEIMRPLGEWNNKVINSKSGNLLWNFSTSTSEAQDITEVSDIYVTSSINKRYTPYTESNLYLNNPLELKSVGTVKDYIENGKIYKNIKRYYFTKEDRWKFWADYNGDNFRYFMDIPFEYKTTGFRVEGEIFCNNFTPTSNVASVATEKESGTIALYKENDSMLYLTLDKKVDDVNDVIPEGTFVDVILPQTEVINLSTQGNLTTYPNGTIIIEPATLVEKQYNDGLQVDLPVKSLTSIKVGAKYLDRSKAVVKENLITHPELENGDFVTIEYIYDDNPIYGTNSIGYLSLEEILDDLWLDNVYTYKVTNGEWELVKITDIEDYEEWLKTEKTSPYTLAPDGVIFGKYEADTKFLRQFPSSLYVDFYVPSRLKEEITQVKARAIVGTKDGVIENPGKYFNITWFKKENKPGSKEVEIGEGEEITIDITNKDAISLEIEDKGAYNSK